MFDRTLSHGIHIQVMKDINARYGVAQDADLHAVFNQAMHDLAVVYNFDTCGEAEERHLGAVRMLIYLKRRQKHA